MMSSKRVAWPSPSQTRIWIALLLWRRKYCLLLEQQWNRENKKEKYEEKRSFPFCEWRFSPNCQHTVSVWIVCFDARNLRKLYYFHHCVYVMSQTYQSTLSRSRTSGLASSHRRDRCSSHRQMRLRAPRKQDNVTHDIVMMWQYYCC